MTTGSFGCIQNLVQLLPLYNVLRTCYFVALFCSCHFTANNHIFYFSKLHSSMTALIPFRPIIILLCGMLLFNLPIFLYKVRLCINSILYIFLCYDKSYSKPVTDPSSYFNASTTSTTSNTNNIIRRKTIYFVRHGESTWNDTFNKGKHRSIVVFILGFIPNLVKAMLYELYLLLSGKMDR